MRHIQKFNESLDSSEKLENAFDKFIGNASELGEITHYEKDHGSGVSTSETAFEAVKEYGKLLEELNKKFDIFKNIVYEEFAQ
jgi:hypothetical protein